LRFYPPPTQGDWKELTAHYAEKLTSVDAALAALAARAWADSCAEWGRFEVGEVIDAQNHVTKAWAAACIVDKRSAADPRQHNLIFDEIQLKWLATGATSDWQSLSTTRGYAPYNKFTRPSLVPIGATSEVSQSVIDCLLRGECTISQTPPSAFATQPWFHCVTCTPTQAHLGCCVSCAVKCHRGHKLVQQKGAFFCDCGQHALEGSEPTAKTRCCLKRKPEGPAEGERVAPPQPPANHHHVHMHAQPHFQLAPNGNMMLVFENIIHALHDDEGDV
jgi:hypothetical protein